MNKQELARRQADRTQEMGKLAAQIHREWWRPLRNRSRRRQVAELWAQEQKEYAEHKAKHHGAGSWPPVSPSYRDLPGEHQRDR